MAHPSEQYRALWVEKRSLLFLHDCVQTVLFELLDVNQPVNDAPADLGVAWAAANPAPAFEGAVRKFPAAGQLDLIDKKVCDVHLASPELVALRGETFHSAALRVVGPRVGRGGTEGWAQGGLEVVRGGTGWDVARLCAFGETFGPLAGKRDCLPTVQPDQY